MSCRLVISAIYALNSTSRNGVIAELVMRLGVVCCGLEFDSFRLHHFFARMNLEHVIWGRSIQNSDPSVIADASTAYVIAGVDASAILNQLPPESENLSSDTFIDYHWAYATHADKDRHFAKFKFCSDDPGIIQILQRCESHFQDELPWALECRKITKPRCWYCTKFMRIVVR